MFSYLILRFTVVLFSLIPFKILYFFSDGIAFFMYKVLRYRYTVIYTNLKNAFPEKTDSEIELIIKKSYLNLSDLMVESIKGMSLSLSEIVRRYHVNNPEIINQVFEKNQSAIGLTSHYNNWEWGAYATSSQIKMHVTAVFKPFNNKYVNRYLYRVRSRFDAQVVSMSQTGRALIENRNKPTLFILIADQNPSSVSHYHRVNFLNQDTICFDGPERIAKKTNYPVLYFGIERVKRGFYEIEGSVLFENPQTTAPGEITQVYMHALEKQIHNEPQNWLWSHRRWKRKKEEITKVDHRKAEKTI